MVQGTASGVGKSALVAGLCRLLRRQGLRVAPFKAQNMSNNAAVCPDGGEIGRAQAAQAEAAGIVPTVDLNPILLKPEGDSRSQVIVRGRVWRRLSAREYHAAKPELLGVVADSLARLRAEYDVVVIEGAGSPAEVNLRASDIVNMAVARLADAPVLLATDIDRGGVFAALVGTLELLEPADRARVQGLLINRFRGDRTLLEPGLAFVEQRTGCPVLGVVPYLRDLRLPSEDSQDLDRPPPAAMGADSRAAVAPGATGPDATNQRPDSLDVAVVRLPRIANFDDFGPLEAEPGVRVRYVRAPAELGVPDLLILPGTKSTLADLAWLRVTGLGTAILRLAAAGAPILGICGGYQILGAHLADPDGLDGPPSAAPGLGLLDVTTVFAGDKATRPVRGTVLAAAGFFACLAGQAVTGYEIHLGRTTGAAAPFARIGPPGPPILGGEGPGPAPATGLPPTLGGGGGPSGIEEPGTAPVTVLPPGLGGGGGADGAISADGLVAGTYVHGLLHNAGLRRALLAALAQRRGILWQGGDAPPEDPYDRLADALAASLDLPRLYALCGLPVATTRGRA
jgi:adenosylcobyric acid synthase